MTFIRFKPLDTNYILEDQTTCIPEPGNDLYCPTETEVYFPPQKPGEQVAWIELKENVNPFGAQVSELRIGLLNCGMLVPGAENIGTIQEADGQYFCVANLPADLTECTYNFVIYNINNPIDCGQFKGMTLSEVIDSGVTLAQVLRCTLEDFIP